MATTFYGILRPLEVGHVHNFPSTAFRLHIGKGHVEGTKVIERSFDLICDTEETMIHEMGVIISMRKYPLKDIIYERELHLAAEHDGGFDWNNRFMEGPRFMLTSSKDFPLDALIRFLKLVIPELNKRLK